MQQTLSFKQLYTVLVFVLVTSRRVFLLFEQTWGRALMSVCVSFMVIRFHDCVNCAKPTYKYVVSLFLFALHSQTRPS